MEDLQLMNGDFHLVYLVTSAGMPCDHVALFVETHELGPGTGHTYQVSGNIQQGMYHNHHPGERPEEDRYLAFITKNLLGKVKVVDHDRGRFRQICDGLEPPPKQFDGPKRLFAGKKLRRCGEWAKDAIERLKEMGVLLGSSFTAE